jgi:hypothetical protein
VTNRTIAITLKTANLTAQVLARALEKVWHKIEKSHLESKTPPGRQTVKKLMNHNVSTNTIPLDGETRLFDKVARKWNVDYAFHKTGENKYLLLFKSGQADAITACFSEYTKLMMDRAKDKRPTILEQLKGIAEQARAKPREHERIREAVHDER